MRTGDVQQLDNQSCVRARLSDTETPGISANENSCAGSLLQLSHAGEAAARNQQLKRETSQMKMTECSIKWSRNRDEQRQDESQAVGSRGDEGPDCSKDEGEQREGTG